MKRLPFKKTKSALIFARNVRAQRKVLGLSQEKLGEKTKLHWTFIGRVERAETSVTLRTIVTLAKGLECKAAELLKGV